MSGGATWYAGRFSRRGGAHGTVDVLAVATDAGWEAVPNPRRLFPKSGQVEMSGVSVALLRAGDWLAFQLTPNTRPRAHTSRISAHRVLFRFADLSSLVSVEAARFLFTREGWMDAEGVGHWGIRISNDRLLTLQLERGRDGRLRTSAQGLARVACYAFDINHLLEEPAAEAPALLYDLKNASPIATYDWSPGADYIAHVIRALAGADDPHLPELITWLELHRDDETGRISATGADQEKAFEALRSGELAARLSADRELMAAYIAAVRDDPLVAQAVAAAAREEAAKDREEVRAKLRDEMAAEHEAEKVAQEAELIRRAADLEITMHARLAEQEAALGRELDGRIAARNREAASADEQRRRAEAAAIEQSAALEAERDALRAAVARLGEEATAHEKLVREAGSRLAALTTAIGVARSSGSEPARAITTFSAETGPAASPLDAEGLGRQVASCVLLTPHGKALMIRFAAYALAGEVPILAGPQVDDFSLVAEALIAAGRLIPFEVDATILTPEDIWSRPGSGILSVVAQAAALAAEAKTTSLVQLRGIDRSAAHSWYPALVALSRRGLLPRRLLLFATLADPTSKEAAELPADACRMLIDEALAEGAGLVAPSLLGAGSNAIAFHLDPGERPSDLAPAMATLPVVADLGAGVDVTTSLRLARSVVEAIRLRPKDQAIAQATAREFCRETGRSRAAVNGGREERRSA